MWFYGPRGRPPRGLSLRVTEARVEYLGLYLDPKWRFKEHFARLAPRVRKVAKSLTRLLPNLGGPREKVRCLFVNVVHAVSLYGSPLWAEVAAGAGARSKFGLLRVAQRVVAFRVIRGFHTVATETAGVLVGIPPLALFAQMYSARYSRRVELLQEVVERDGLREALANAKRQAWRQLLQDWEQRLEEPRAAVQTIVQVVRPYLQMWLEQGAGRLTYRMTQVLTGHGCFGEYLCRIKKEPTAQCHECRAVSDSVRHTVEHCPQWANKRRELVAKIGADLSLCLKRALARDKDK
ncbi:uncharacterized protein LOC109861253 [Pseudomyrmex gracilis]|uniref:uncharacterized protein LOC109861253 n=1 Tax=Pseudomyrmex gracilis TaxID=219809 RepID=UPI000995D325|nr:uncharacterized protein LOC109861253 [Pseudomyrmex gracilis]